MIKTVSSRLTAQFNVDGSHLHRYGARKPTLTKSICEDLILNNQVLIPTVDFLTAVGLLQILGETSFITLLEHQRIKFIRTRSVCGYARGTELDGGLATFSDPKNKRPQDSPIADSVASALATVKSKLSDHKKVFDLIVFNTSAEETDEIINKVRREAIADLKQTTMWKPQYEIKNPDLLALPGIGKMQMRVLGDSSPEEHVIYTLLALALYNADLLLAQRYGCENISSCCPIGDLLDLKTRRAGAPSQRFWELLEVNEIPDLSLADFSQPGAFESFEKALTTRNADEFRKWFNSIKNYDRIQVMKEYVGLLRDVPWISKLPAKSFRFVATTGLGALPVIGPLVGTAAGLFDSFVVERLFRGRSPKFFVDDLNRIALGLVRKTN